MKSRVLVAALLAVITGSAGASERLSIRVSPSVSFAPANLVVRTTVEADSANRSIEIIAESDDFYRSSEIPLDGDRAPRVTQFEFIGLPSGTYAVRAVLWGAGDNPRATVQSQVNVVEGGRASR